MDDPFRAIYPPFKWEPDEEGDYRPQCPACNYWLTVTGTASVTLETEFSSKREIGFGVFSYVNSSPQEMLDSGSCKFICGQCGNNYVPPDHLTQADWQ